MTCTAEVNNIPEDAERYIVARVFEGELWYWGSWDNKNKAHDVAEEIGGVMVENRIDRL